MLEHFRAVGVDAMVFAAGDRVASYAGEPVVSMPGVPAQMYTEVSLSVPGEKTFAQLVAFDPDVVHVLGPTVSGLRGMQFARRLNKPLVVSFHTHLMEMARFYNLGIFEGTLWQLHRWVYRHADHVLATSKHAVTDLEAHGIGPVGLWRRGVDVSTFSPDYASDNMRRRLSGGNPEKTLLLSAGRLAPEKQVSQIRAVLDAMPGLHLAIVGDGPHRQPLEAHYAGYPVTFAGYMSGDELSTAYASADIFVFPGANETFGNVILEAMASGLPVISCASMGSLDVLNDGEGCHIAPPEEVEFAGRVLGLINDPADAHQLSEKGRQYAASGSAEAKAADMLQFYERVASNTLLPQEA
jgi:glycosyltransferase involved in cell wall biosynthesis